VNFNGTASPHSLPTGQSGLGIHAGGHQKIQFDFFPEPKEVSD